MRFFCRITRLIQQFKLRNALKIKLQFLEAKEFKKAFMLYQGNFSLSSEYLDLPGLKNSRQCFSQAVI